MKIKLVLAALLIAASSASATVTLQFNNAAGSITNFANSSGVGGTSGTAMVWGIIIDTTGNGFAFNQPGTHYNTTGVTYTGGTAQSLTILEGGGASDDVLFLSPNLMNIIGAAGADGAPQGTNRVTSLASVPLTLGATSGDAFAIVWFQNTTVPAGGAVQGGTSFGALTNAGFIIPADGNTTSFSELFVGPDSLKTQAFTIGVPEPSSILLGLLGALGLLRRRR